MMLIFLRWGVWIIGRYDEILLQTFFFVILFLRKIYLFLLQIFHQLRNFCEYGDKNTTNNRKTASRRCNVWFMAIEQWYRCPWAIFVYAERVARPHLQRRLPYPWGNTNIDVGNIIVQLTTWQEMHNRSIYRLGIKRLFSLFVVREACGVFF